MAKAITTGARTLALLRKKGWMAAIVERWNPYVKIRQDLFGIFDIMAIAQGGVACGVQCTTNTNWAAHLDKIRSSPNYKKWLDLGGLILVVGWAKMGERGKRKLWTSKELYMTLESHPPIVVNGSTLPQEEGLGAE
jgi:hypothetical protein